MVGDHHKESGLRVPSKASAPLVNEVSNNSSSVLQFYRSIYRPRIGGSAADSGGGNQIGLRIRGMVCLIQANWASRRAVQLGWYRKRR